MSKTVVIDELHLTLRLPARLPEAQVKKARRILLGATFLARLRRTLRSLIGSYPQLTSLTVLVSR
jgi:hypothetical protein